MKRVVILLFFGALVWSAATGCSQRTYAWAGDDMYSTHDFKDIKAREAGYSNYEEQIRAETRAQVRAEERAKAREEAAQLYGTVAVTGNEEYNAVMSDDYQSMYADKLRKFDSDSYVKPAESYEYDYNNDYQVLLKYDPNEYNVVVAGNKVYVEPKNVRYVYGYWGAPTFGFRASSRGWMVGAGWGYHDYWGWNNPYYDNYWGWGGYYDPWRYGGYYNHYYPYYGHGWHGGHGWGGGWGGHGGGYYPGGGYYDNNYRRADASQYNSGGGRVSGGNSRDRYESSGSQSSGGRVSSGRVSSGRISSSGGSSTRESSSGTVSNSSGSSRDRENTNTNTNTNTNRQPSRTNSSGSSTGSYGTRDSGGSSSGSTYGGGSSSSGSSGGSSGGRSSGGRSSGGR